MKHLFVLNPKAGKRDRTVELTKMIAAACKPRGLDYELRISAYAGDCTQIVREAAERGGELRVYACGGDGTLNEVVTGAMGHPNVAVTHIPCGSGNDFIRIFSDTAPFSDLTQLLDPAETLLDVIGVNGERYGLNICSVGIDARIAADAAKFKKLPGVSGSGAYGISVLTNVFQGIRFPCEIELNGRTIRGEETLVCICNGRYYGGGFNPVPEAQPDDGVLDVLAVRGVGLAQFAALLGKYRSGRFRELSDYITYYRTDKVIVRTPQESIINLDGEVYRASRVHFTVLPASLRFFYPKSVFFREKTEEIKQNEEILSCPVEK